MYVISYDITSDRLRNKIAKVLLGYHFSSMGKSVPTKAVQGLQDRLETMWLTSAALSIEDKMTKAIEIIGGWEQYFREKRKIESIFEYMALIYAAQSKKDYQEDLIARRWSVQNIYKDIALYLAKMWKGIGQNQMQLLEYEQYYQVWNPEDKLVDKALEELLENYEKVMILEEHDSAIEIMQIYTDRGEYEKAAFWMQRSEQMQREIRNVSDGSLLCDPIDQVKAMVLNQATAQKILHIFVGREDMFSKETLGYGGKRQAEFQPLPLTDQKIMEHLNGNITIGTYIQRPNSTVKYLVIDVDISKKVMLQIQRDSPVFQTYLEQAWHRAEEIRKVLKGFGIYSYIECSGCRGYHVWTFFTEWIPVRYVNMLSDIIETKITEQEKEEICIEFFPNKTRVKAEKFGQIIKLPYGRHVRTNEQSCFLDDSGNPIADVNGFLDNIAKNTLNAVKKVLAKNMAMKEDIQEKIVVQTWRFLGRLRRR